MEKGLLAEHDATLAEFVVSVGPSGRPVWEDWVAEHGGLAKVGDSPGGFPDVSRFEEAKRVAFTKARGALSASFIAGYLAGKNDPNYLNSAEYRLRVSEIEAARSRREETSSPTEEKAFSLGALAARKDWRATPTTIQDQTSPSLWAQGLLVTALTAPFWIPIFVLPRMNKRTKR